MSNKFYNGQKGFKVVFTNGWYRTVYAATRRLAKKKAKFAASLPMHQTYGYKVKKVYAMPLANKPKKK